MKSYHMAVSISGARARLADPHDRNMAKNVLSVQTVSEGRAFLDEAEAQGLKVIPFEGCDDHAPTGECLGHNKQPAEKEADK